MASVVVVMVLLVLVFVTGSAVWTVVLWLTSSTLLGCAAVVVFHNVLSRRSGTYTTFGLPRLHFTHLSQQQIDLYGLVPQGVLAALVTWLVELVIFALSFALLGLIVWWAFA